MTSRIIPVWRGACAFSAQSCSSRLNAGAATLLFISVATALIAIMAPFTHKYPASIIGWPRRSIQIVPSAIAQDIGDVMVR